jgi:hypothetical protein
MSTHRWCCCGGGGGGGNPCDFCSDAAYAGVHMCNGINGIVTFQRGPAAAPTDLCIPDPCNNQQVDCERRVESINTWTFNVQPFAVYKTPYLGCCYASRVLYIDIAFSNQYTVWEQNCAASCPLVSHTTTQTFAKATTGCYAVQCFSSGGVSELYHRLKVCGGSWNDWFDYYEFPSGQCSCTAEQLASRLTGQSSIAHPEFTICWKTPLKPLQLITVAEFSQADWCGCNGGNTLTECFDPLYPQPACLGMGCGGPNDGDAFWGQDPSVIIAHDPQNPPPDCGAPFCGFAPVGTRWNCGSGLCTGSGNSYQTNCNQCEYTQNVSTPQYV